MPQNNSSMKRHRTSDSASLSSYTNAEAKSSGALESSIAVVSNTCNPIPLTGRPRVGLKIDICDAEKIWASATIVSLRDKNEASSRSRTGEKRSRDTSGSEDDYRDYEVTIAYDGWGKEWNETLRYPNLRIVRHFTFSKQFKSLVDIQAPKKQYSSSAAPEPMLLWPCRVQVRMPTPNLDTAAYFLELENLVYIEPYLPDKISSTNGTTISIPRALLSVFPNCQLDKKKGDNDQVVHGAWLPTKLLRQFRKFDFTMFSKQQLLSNFPLSGFLRAYENAVNDQTTPGTLPHRLFMKGSLVNKKFRVNNPNYSNNNYTGAFLDDDVDPQAYTPRTSTSITSCNTPQPSTTVTNRQGPVSPPKFPPSIKIVEHLYPKTTRLIEEASDVLHGITNSQWLGVITTGGGNEVIVGKFASQSEAHEAATQAMAARCSDGGDSTTTSTGVEEDRMNNRAIESTTTQVDRRDSAGVHLLQSTKVQGQVLHDKAGKKNNEAFKLVKTIPSLFDSIPVVSVNGTANEKIHVLENVNNLPIQEGSSFNNNQKDFKVASEEEFGAWSSSKDAMIRPTTFPGAYRVFIPLTEEGLLLKIGPPSKTQANSMPGFNATFQGFNKLSNGRKSIPELQNLIHGVGDWFVEVDNVSLVNLEFKQIMELIAAKKKINPSGLHCTFVDCCNTTITRSSPATPTYTTTSTSSHACIDLTNDDIVLEVINVVRSSIPHILQVVDQSSISDIDLEVLKTETNKDNNVNPTILEKAVGDVNNTADHEEVINLTSSFSGDGHDKSLGESQEVAHEASSDGVDDDNIIDATQNFANTASSSSQTVLLPMMASTLDCFAASIVTQGGQPKLQENSVLAAELPILASQQAKGAMLSHEGSTSLLECSHIVNMKNMDDALEARAVNFDLQQLQDQESMLFSPDNDEMPTIALDGIFLMTPATSLSESQRDVLPKHITNGEEEEASESYSNTPSAVIVRQVDNCLGSEQDLRNISLEAVVAAAESMFDPSTHTFTAQEWTIELIRHKAYLKEVTVDANKASANSETMPTCEHASKADSLNPNSHARKQRKPRQLHV